MDEFVPSNTDPERRGRVAHERYDAALTGTRVEWVYLTAAEHEAWCAAAEAAFEEGRAFEREQMMRAEAKALKTQLDDVDRGGPDGVVLQHGEQMISYVYRTARGNTISVEVLPNPVVPHETEEAKD